MEAPKLPRAILIAETPSPPKCSSAVVGNLVNHDPCALEVSHGEAEREFFGRYAHNLEAGSFPSCFATASAGMNGSSLSGKLFAQNGKSLSSMGGAKEMCSTLLLRLGLEGPQSRVFGLFHQCPLKRPHSVHLLLLANPLPA